jgi:hypothetical protein
LVVLNSNYILSYYCRCPAITAHGLLDLKQEIQITAGLTARLAGQGAVSTSDQLALVFLVILTLFHWLVSLAELG